MLQVQLRDNNDILVAYIDNKIQNLSWEWDRIGGCGGCQFQLVEPFDGVLAGSLQEDYSIKAYIEGTLWYSGFIDRVSPNVSGKDEIINVSCLGYVNQLKRIIIKDKTYSGQELSNIAKDILDNYVVSNTDITASDFIFKDEAGKTVTIYGNAQIDTAQSKFGGASGLFDGAGDYLTIPINSDWNFNEDFTIDLWIRIASINGGQVILDNISNQDWALASTGDYALAIGGDSKPSFYVKNLGTAGANGTSLDTNTWYHIAVVRSGNTVTLYVNGTADGATFTSSAPFGNTQILRIGGRLTYYGGDWDGWLDEIRISKDIARWTANFTPPTSAYTSDAKTKLLLHCDTTERNFEDSKFTADYLYFNENAYECISKLADIAGKREWGVRADKSFFFKARNDSINRYYFIKEFSSFQPIKDFNPIITAIYLEGGEGYSDKFQITNKITTREEIISNSSIISQSVGQQYARMYLKEKGVLKRSYIGIIPNYNTRLENTIPLGKAAVNLKIGINLKYDVVTQLYDSSLKYDGGTESFQIEKIKYELKDENIDTTLYFGPVPPALSDELKRLEYLIVNERNI